jgi:serine/threonine-protein kinase
MLDVVVKVCDALALAHSRGVFHCDVKPDNVMVGDFGEVYLMDWGIARLASEDAEHSASSGPRQGTHVGTPAYMSPEHARGRLEDLDARSDVFGVGTMLYEIIARRAPFTRASALQAITAATECAIPPLVSEDARPPAPRGLLRIVERAMAMEKQDRYQDARELRRALVDFMRGGAQFPATAVEANEHIVRQGDAGDAAYIIVSGRCEVYKTVDGERVVLRTMGPGEVFGETAILSPGPRTASVIALEPTTLRKITREVFEAEVDSMKPWMGSFVRTLAARFREREDG